jgi:hypothetical protein
MGVIYEQHMPELQVPSSGRPLRQPPAAAENPLDKSFDVEAPKRVGVSDRICIGTVTNTHQKCSLNRPGFHKYFAVALLGYLPLNV